MALRRHEVVAKSPYDADDNDDNCDIPPSNRITFVSPLSEDHQRRRRRRYKS